MGPFHISRRSGSVGIRIATLLFTLLYTTNLFLLTTAPEEIAAALQVFARPFRRWGWPVNEVMLTMTLALRFLPVVLEEIQNIIRAVRTRDVRWQALGFKEVTRLVLALVERLLANLFLRAAQTADAMQVRGYLGSQHAVPLAPTDVAASWTG